VDERRLSGGNIGGAVLVNGTVRRPAGPRTPAVHALLAHLTACDFQGAPRPFGIDEQGREMLSFLAGSTVGDTKPWPAWVHSDQALLDVGGWLRRYHHTVASFIPPQDACWRGSRRPWRPGDIIGHNDAAPYNAVWQNTTAASHAQASVDSSPAGRLVGFIDWDFAAPCPPIWDLAFVAFSWVPLHSRSVACAEGFTRFADRPRRLRLLLNSYQYSGTLDALLDAVRARVHDHIRDVRELASSGDPALIRLVADGVLDRLSRALAELDADADLLRADPHD
jgi:hypothetical protein